MFPVRKEYALTALGPVGLWPFRRRARLFFKYREATISELLEFQEEAKDGDLRGWTLKFLAKHSARPLTPKECSHLLDSWHPLWLAVKKTYLKAEGSEDAKAIPAPPFSSTLALLAKELNIDPVRFIETYTLAQMREITAGITWNMREHTKEGRAENARQLGKQAVAIAKADKGTIMQMEALKKLA